MPTATDARLSAYLGIMPSLSAEATEVFDRIDDFGMQLNNVRIALTRLDGSFVYDTTVALVAGQDSLVLELAVPLTESRELISARVELRDSALVVFEGSENVELRRGGSPRVTPMIVLDYTGPGALARLIDMSPRDTTIAPRSGLNFTAAARDTYGSAVRDVRVLWSLSDPTAGDIDAEGNFRPKGRGETWVIARLPTGLRDSARVAVANSK
jgi:hypothetical protein